MTPIWYLADPKAADQLCWVPRSIRPHMTVPITKHYNVHYSSLWEPNHPELAQRAMNEGAKLMEDPENRMLKAELAPFRALKVRLMADTERAIAELFRRSWT